MFASKVSKLTTLMIYIGTLLLSILSFFTTYYGMTILIDDSLAMVGSLGLQIALLGIAWNLMRVRENRLTYIVVFLVAAVFSVFFSYANFDSALKADTRVDSARAHYSAALRPFLDRYATVTQDASLKGQYQLVRLNGLLEKEQKQGWATVIDEGTHDEFIQSVLDGARRTIDSWKVNQGYDYQQGSGDGIIVDFLESRVSQANEAVGNIDKYSVLIDSISLVLSSKLPVEHQFELANMAWISFPFSEVGMLVAKEPRLFAPPDHSNYVERPVSRQQAFLLVIGDLFEMDYLAAFSLLLAIAIDLIVVIMAFAGSHIVDDMDYILHRVKQDIARRLGEVSLDDPNQLDVTLRNNLDKLEKALSYRLDMDRVASEYDNERSRFRKQNWQNKNGSSEQQGNVFGRIGSRIKGWTVSSRSVEKNNADLMIEKEHLASDPSNGSRTPENKPEHSL